MRFKPGELMLSFMTARSSAGWWREFPIPPGFGGDLRPQNYAIALPVNSELRLSLDVALLQAVTSDWWLHVLYRYLGRTDAGKTMTID
jgi:hypothetical protein